MKYLGKASRIGKAMLLASTINTIFCMEESMIQKKSFPRFVGHHAKKRRLEFGQKNSKEDSTIRSKFAKIVKVVTTYSYLEGETKILMSLVTSTCIQFTCMKTS